MNKRKGKQVRRRNAWDRLVTWVDGDREPKDQTLFVMERRQSKRVRPSDEEWTRREKRRLREFFNLYPVAAVLTGGIIITILFLTVMEMPAFGQESNPTNNEVPAYYLEHSEEETGSSNAVTGMILSYRGFDTLGESCVLFLAVTCVMMLLQRDEKNTGDRDLKRMNRYDTNVEQYPDIILGRSAWLLVPFILLFAVYVLLNGEHSPGGGFAGGTILGASLILFSCAFGPNRVRTIMGPGTYQTIRISGLIMYALIYGTYIFLGANGLPDYLSGMVLLIDLAVGLVVACTVYGFYALLSRGEL